MGLSVGLVVVVLYWKTGKVVGTAVGICEALFEGAIDGRDVGKTAKTLKEGIRLGLVEDCSEAALLDGNIVLWCDEIILGYMKYC